MLSLHLVTIVFSEDVIKFLLGNETILIRVNVTNGQSYLLQSVFLKHDLDQLLLSQAFSFLYFFVYAVPMKVTKVATKISFELFVRLSDLDLSEYLFCLLVLFDIKQRLQHDNRRISHVLDIMDLENGVTLLILQLDSEFCQHSLELLYFNQTTVLFERIDLHVLEQLDPVLWVLFDHLLVDVLVQA